MKHKLEHISKLQVPAWSWLGINDTKVELDFTGIKPYGKNPFQKEYKNIRIEKTNGTEEFRVKGSTSGATEGIRDFVERYKNQCFYISVEDGQSVEEPVVLDFSLDNGNALLVEGVLIEAGENSKATFILNYSSEEGAAGLHCGYTQLNIKKGAQVNLIKLQTLSEKHIHVDATEVYAEEAAESNIILAELGSKETVSACNVTLTGENSKADVDSIYIGNRSKAIDINYRIEYDGKNTEGYITERGVLLDRSRKVSKNTLDFIAGASGARGREEESVIALSEKAVNVSAPLLLCAEDHVEGQHASNIGKLDDNKLFYFMSRGLSEKEAKKLMIEASFAPIVNKIPLEAFRNQISLYTREVLQYGE